MSIFKKLFGGTSKAELYAQWQKAAADDKARKAAEEAATPAEDRDSARSAADRRLRRLAQRRGFAGTAQGTAGGGSVVVKTLLGQ